MYTHSLQSFLPVVGRRKFTPEEERNIRDSIDKNWFGKIFESYGTPAHETLASPGKAAIMAAILGGGAGALGGASLAGKQNAGIGALAGGGLGASIAGALSYYLRNQSNEDMLELMRRSPENPTLRDIWSDPLVQADEQRKHDEAMARLYAHE